jgi:hypothetical protein
MRGMHQLLRRRLRFLVLSVACALCAVVAAALPVSAGAATTRGPGFRLAALAPAFTSPVWVGDAGDGTGALLVVEQRGVVWRVAGARKTLALDLRGAVR